MVAGFDNDMYLGTQSEHIRESIQSSEGKLYLEFVGKLFDDYYTSMALLKFMPDNKIRMLMEFNSQAEAIVVINAEDIIRNKVRKDIGVDYDQEVLRLVDFFNDKGIEVCRLVITNYNGQSTMDAFQMKAQTLGLKVYRHYLIGGYPTNISLIISDRGYGSGKMAVCLSQLYHEYTQSRKANYTKFETFPIWNLSLNHPMNIAYKVATTELID